MRKLSVIWQILFSDKWAVFTFNDVPEDPEKLTAPYFKWNICFIKYNILFLRLINTLDNETTKKGYTY